ncbi:MAG: FkbM family methyltransferase [Bacteroidetes bacterium]|nr:FkbM family methyltransferase [Bacteroidota bacterium]
MRVKLSIIGGRLLRGFYEFFTNASFRRWIGFILTKPLGKRYKPCVFRWFGAEFRVPDALSFFWQYHEIMVRKAYHFPSSIPEPVIYDCGSNVGLSLFSYRMQHPHSRLVAFEPDPKVYALLEKNIRANHLSPVELFQAAVWKNNGFMNFNSEGADGGALGSGTLEVRTIDLGQMLHAEQRVDFLKMDIEGAERIVLPHIRPHLHKIKHMFIEYHSFPNEPQELHRILQILSEEGFTYYLETDVRRKNPFTPRTTAAGAPEFQTNVFAVNMNS